MIADMKSTVAENAAEAAALVLVPLGRHFDDACEGSGMEAHRSARGGALDAADAFGLVSLDLAHGETPGLFAAQGGLVPGGGRPHDFVKAPGRIPGELAPRPRGI